MCLSSLYSPQRYFPREHLHVTCDNEEGDYSCLMGSGVCVMNNQPTLLLHDEYEQGTVLKASWFIFPFIDIITRFLSWLNGLRIFTFGKGLRNIWFGAVLTLRLGYYNVK